jgi:hypothetical protein
MQTGFLGIPWLWWGILCVVLALIYLVFWPRPARNAPPRPAVRQGVLRWFHALVWALLAAACFVQAAGFGSASTVAAGLALVALVLYIAFIGALLIERRAVR